MSETWIILGASSAMAPALARKLSEQGCRLILAGRDADDLAHGCADCLARGARDAQSVPFDARDPSGFPALLALLDDGPVNCAVFAGSMPDQALIDADPAMIDGVIRDSFTGPAQVLHLLAPQMERRGTGAVVGIG
ncbi:hypothetical protein LCGC14_1814480, partial [marine sediment metagenome]